VPTGSIRKETVVTSPEKISPVAARLPLQRIVYPQSIAVIGASEDPAKFGGRIFKALLHHHYRGRLFPINPLRDSIFGIKSYAAIDQLPEAVDLALLAVPAGKLLSVVEECAKAGVGACVVITAKLGEFDQAGALLQQQAVAIARRYGMRLMGPNCMGIITPPHALALSSTATLTSIPQLHRGGVAFISQSGALLGTLLMLAHDHAIGFSGLVSVGNQADLELCDFLQFFIDDPATTTICLYVETFKNVARFRQLALQARDKGKPLLIVKAGRTEAGQIAARSHTASLAGSFAAFSALADETGLLLMDEPEGMVLTAGFFDKTVGLPPSGTAGVGVIVSSGGAGTVLADRLSLAGLPLAAWHASTDERLRQHFLPQHINNPLDLGSHQGTLQPAVFIDSINAVADDPDVTVVLFLLTPQPLMPATVEGLIAAGHRSQKPFVVVIDTASFAADVRAMLNDSGIPVVSRVDDALRIVSTLQGWRYVQQQPYPTLPRVPPQAAPALPRQQGSLTETEVKQLLKTYGIAVNREAVASSADHAVHLAQELGFPVVLKGRNRQLVHKSDLGLVQLNLYDEAAVRQAFSRVKQTGKDLPGELDVLVAEQIGAGIELAIGSRFDEEYGVQILVGFGGVLIEVVKDFAVATAPLDAERAEILLKKLRLYPLLQGVRGKPAADIPAVIQALVALSRLACDLGPRLRELDINPLIVAADGQGAIAVDGRATLADLQR
jgi:acyl-CoA synthetase (NDP forming)